MNRPEDDHLYWAEQASAYNTQAERKSYLEKAGLIEKTTKFKNPSDRR